jgi:DinB superfamily
MKLAPVVFALAMLALPGFSQDNKNPVTTVVKDMLTRQHKNLVAAVEEMPADKFSFKPTPLQETFGHLVLHITEANYFLCSRAGDVSAPKTEELNDTDSKDKLVGALKASFDFCESAVSKADDSKLGDTVEAFGGRKQPRAWAWIGMASNWADHYAAAAMYLRLNGLLPPTAQPKK